MVELEIDGRKVEVTEGSMVMHAASKLGLYVPHFCYHKKLSIAANCRMCLVEVEKAPKPLPACATPVTAGMKVFTKSAKAVAAQKSVMEFLLINHPLDCPICDQGGECQLQDLAVGYGGSSSHYHEEKRVVFHKSMGPLVSAEEMSRCIHCTRCVRFGQEIAGIMELGMGGRGEHSEIMTFVGRSIDSEVSGNMIDICPVGALTSKPFRYSARTWELSRRRSIAAHDSLGSNIVVQVKQDRVMRVLPLENDAVNECWISDRDRFSYEGLNSPDRLLAPRIKQDGQWHDTDWDSALAYAAHALSSVASRHGAEQIGALASPNASLEELHLLQKLVRGLGSDNVDFRLRQADAAFDSALDGAPWLGMEIAEIGVLGSLLLIGSVLRKDHPLLSVRVRQASKRGLALSSIHAFEQNLLMPVQAQVVRAPSAWPQLLAEVLVAVHQLRGAEVPGGFEQLQPGDEARAIAASLTAEGASAIWLGNAAIAHPQAGELLRLADAIARACDARVGIIGDGANALGGYLAGATPSAVGACAATAIGRGGKGAAAMLADPLKAYLLLNVEPSLDTLAGLQAARAIGKADTVIALAVYESPELLEIADCLLPIGPYTETAGSFVNAEARLQAFNGVVRAAGEARPAWKVLRVMGNRLELAGFEQNSAEDVRAEATAGGIEARLARAVRGPLSLPGAPQTGLQRLADVPLYWSDSLVRRAASLQKTQDAAAPMVTLSAADAASNGVGQGQRVRVSMNGQSIELTAQIDPTQADGVLRIPAAHPLTAALPAMFGEAGLERI